MSEDQPNPQEQQITPDIPQDGQYEVIRAGGDVEPGWSLKHSTYDPISGEIVAFKPQYDEQKRFLGDIYKTVIREEIIEFNSPENKDWRRQEKLQADLGEDAVRNEVDAPYPQRIEQLFSPVGKKEDKQPDVNPYDALLDPSINMEDRDYKDAEVRAPTGRGVVTDDSLKVALKDYMTPMLNGGKDLQIAEMIKAAAHNSLLNPEEAMQLLREDGSLRKEIGIYLLNKLENEPYLPDRVAGNGRKKSNVLGYEDITDMTSHEYVALLAMAKLDGTFQAETETKNEDSKKLYGRRDGNHRIAADKILN